MAGRLILALVFCLTGGLAFGEEFSPSDLEGLVAWYDARTLYGEHVKLRDGESVEFWPDSSGNGHDLRAAAKGRRAVFRTLRLNELPLVELQEASSFLVTNPFSLADHTIVLVHDTRKRTRALFSSDTDDQLGIVLNTKDGRHQIRRGLKTWAYNVDQPAAGFGITALARDASGLHSLINGKPRSSGIQSAEALRVARMFHIRFSRAVSRDAEGMSIAELLFYDRRLGDGELALLTLYLATRYDIELDPSHGEIPTPEPEAFDWTRAKVLAASGTTIERNLNVEDGVAIEWNAPSEAPALLRHDTEDNPSRIYCTRDATKVRIAVNLSLRTSEPGAELTILVLKNHERYLEHIDVTRPVSGSSGDARLTGRYETPVTLDAGDYIEIVVARNGAAGTVSMVPSENFLLIAVE